MPTMPPEMTKPEKKMPATPDQAAEDITNEMAAKIEKVAGSVPTPTEAIPVDAIAQLVGALNEATGYLSDGQIPPVEYKPPGRMGGVKTPLPGDVYVLLVALASAVAMAAEKDPSLAGLGMNPGQDATTRAGIQKMTAALNDMARSEPLKNAVLSADPAKVAERSAESGKPAAMPANDDGEDVEDEYSTVSGEES